MSSVFVTINGINVDVIDGTAFEDPVDLRGDVVRGDGGDLQTSERTPKRRFGCVARFAVPADFDTFRAAVSISGAPGVPGLVPVTSSADGLTRGASLTCYVRCGRADYRSRGAGAFRSTMVFVPLTIVEA